MDIAYARTYASFLRTPRAGVTTQFKTVCEVVAFTYTTRLPTHCKRETA